MRWALSRPHLARKILDNIKLRFCRSGAGFVDFRNPQSMPSRFRLDSHLSAGSAMTAYPRRTPAMQLWPLLGLVRLHARHDPRWASTPGLVS